MTIHCVRNPQQRVSIAIKIWKQNNGSQCPLPSDLCYFFRINVNKRDNIVLYLYCIMSDDLFVKSHRYVFKESDNAFHVKYHIEAKQN